MKQKMILGLLLVVLLAGCSTTAQLTSVWKDALYQTRPTRVLVVGISDQAVSRRVMEDAFVAQIRARGTDAIASYTVLGDKQKDDEAVLAAKVKELGADALLMSRLVNKQMVRVYMPEMPYYPPPYYNTWPEYYGYRYSRLPGYVAEEQFAALETNLYETDKNSLVWASVSDNEFRGGNQREVQAYVGVMVKYMAGYGLLNKKPRE